MDEEEDAGNTTLYFDAEEGVLRDEDGDEVTFGEDGDEIEEEIIDEDDEGNRTPQPEQSEEQTQRPHHITGMFNSEGTASSSELWPRAPRRLSSAMPSM